MTLTSNADSAIQPDMGRKSKDLPEQILGRYSEGSRDRLQAILLPGQSMNDLLREALELILIMRSSRVQVALSPGESTIDLLNVALGMLLAKRGRRRARKFRLDRTHLSGVRFS